MTSLADWYKPLSAFSVTSEWCRKNRHVPVKEQYQKLTEKLRGHYYLRMVHPAPSLTTPNGIQS